MKKVVLALSLLLFGIFTSYAQQRLTLLEHFTGASCSPCSFQNPGLEELASKNTDKMVMLVHQCNIPSYDPMYNDYPTGPDARLKYYSIASVPTCVLDGNGVGPLSPMNLTQSDIDTRAAVKSPFIINLSFEKTATDINVVMKIMGLETTTGTFYARIAVIENEIAFSKAPGSNGEREFIKVVKQYLPNPKGTALAKDWKKDDTITLKQKWTLNKVYDENELAIIAYIQNDDTKEVAQAAFAKTKILNALDAKVSKLHEIPDVICYGKQSDLAPITVVTNYGSTPITSFDLECNFNGKVIKTINWTGKLNHLDYVPFHLTGMTFDGIKDSNLISTTVKNINGGGIDLNTKNDSKFFSFNFTKTVSKSFKIKYRTGGLGTGFIWRIISLDGATPPQEYVNYTDGKKGTDTVYYDINLPEGCWKFNFKKGTSSDLTNFFFEIIDNGKVIHRTETVGYILQIPFFVNGAESVQTYDNADVNIYPNPAKDYVRINNENLADIYVYDMLGTLVMQILEVDANADLNIKSLTSGRYCVKIVQNEKITTKPLQIVE